MKSWKIGAVSGLIAGIVSGIVTIFHALSMFNLELPYWGIPSPPETPLMYITTVELTMNVVWGFALGIFYSKFYGLIPGRDVSKGLVYGLILGLILNIRTATFTIVYDPEYIFVNIILASIQIVYGIVLGVLYEFLQSKYYPSLKKLQVSKYDIKEGIRPGLIAGLIGGIVIFFAHALFWDPINFPKYVEDIGFLISQLGTHAFINMVWGAVFGILYVMFYSRIPGKRISKGIVFGMIIFFITSFRIAIYWLLYGNISYFIGWGNGIFLFLVYGLVLGLLYRKPTEAIAVKKKKVRLVEMVSCHFCDASIPKGSKFCKECGKKQ